MSSALVHSIAEEAALAALAAIGPVWRDEGPTQTTEPGIVGPGEGGAKTAQRRTVAGSRGRAVVVGPLDAVGAVVVVVAVDFVAVAGGAG